MIDLDLQYAREWSPWSDVAILARTPFAVLRRETA
jgi:lipopolysaccharide/colanic/teichoic acid biosynthesis glycosyltransferase